MLVIYMQRWRHDFGDDPRAKAPRRSRHDPSVEDQVRVPAIAKVEILLNHFLEEGSSRQGSIQHLRQSELDLQDRDVVKSTAFTISFTKRVGQRAQPFAQ